MNKENLIKQFKESGLKLIVRDKPFRVFGSDPRIFQMDVLRKVTGTRRKEWFEMFLGEGDVNVQIIDRDEAKCQILLLVQEPERTFEVTERKRRWVWRETLSQTEKRIDERRAELKSKREYSREDRFNFYVKQTTSPEKRHFLMGVDERQLFVAQLTKGVPSIVEARRSLGETVQFHEGKRKNLPMRQGEWFFLEATDQQVKDIELLLEKRRTWVVEKENIGKYAGREGGNPHIADEIVVIPQGRGLIAQCKQTKWARKHRPIIQSDYPIRKKEVFVRGRVRHIDHKTITHSKWYQVILNNENQEVATASWID